MKTASYAHSLHNSTAFTQVNQDDGIATRAWKVPTGRIASSAVTVFALAEALFFSLATVVFSPLYLLANDRFHVLADDAKDSAKTAGKAAGRIFGFGRIEIEEPIPAPAPKAPKPLAKPTTLKGRVLAFFKDRASDVGYTALKHPNTTLVLCTVAVAASAAYYFGLFDYAATLIQTPKAPITPNMQNMCKLSDFNPFPHEVCKLTDAPKTAATSAVKAVVDKGLQAPFVNTAVAAPTQAAATAVAHTAPAIVENGICQAPFVNATVAAPTQAAATAVAHTAPAIVENGICIPAPTTPWANATDTSSTFAYFPKSTSVVEDRVALWTAKAAEATPSLPTMNWAKLYPAAAPTEASVTPISPLMTAAPKQPPFTLNANWIGWVAQKLNGTK